MAVFKNGLFINYNSEIINPVGNLVASVAANNFFQSAGITNQQQRYAVYNLVSDLQSYNIWNKMKAVYPMVGQVGVSSSFQFNLKDPATFRCTFSGSWTFSETGAKPDGLTACIDTGVVGGTDILTANAGIGVYLRNNNLKSAAFGFGTNYHIYPRFVDSKTYYRLAGADDNYNVGSSLGLFHGYTTSSSTQWYNSVKQGETARAGAIDSANLFFGGQRPSLSQYDDREIAYAFASEYLTDTEAANLYTAVQRFQTTLGRQV